MVLVFPILLTAQSITGKLVDLSGNGLSGLQLQLYIYPNVYNTTSGTDGSFIFNDINNVKNEQLPTEYTISDNYPNPFNPKTRINVTLPKSGKVRIDIYNLLGQKVIDEIERNFNAGENYIDLELNGLSNGFYIARIAIDEKYTVTKKLMLLYGSRHLPAGVPNIQLNKSASDVKSTQDIKIDSLVVTGSSIGKIVFTALPHLTGNYLDLGNLSITGTITINSLNKSSAAPCEFLTITGSGFDTTAALSVRFFDGEGFSVAIPVMKANATTINITVPPFINMATGGFEAGVVNVEVIQTSGTVTLTSNTISGFEISSLPTLTLPPGSVTSNIAGFLELTLTDAQNRLSELDTSSGGQINTEDLRSKLESMRILFGQLKNKIRESMANPSQAENVGTINGIPVSLDQESLRIADQWMVAVINGILAEMQGAPPLSKQANRLMSSHFQATECADVPELCESLKTMKMVGSGEDVSSQQYLHSVVPLARNILVDLSIKFGAATAVIGAVLATVEVSIPLNVVALLTTANLEVLLAQYGMDASWLAVNSNDKEAAKRVLDDFDSGIQFVLPGVISPIISDISPKAGICYDLYNGLEPLFEDKLPAFLAQAITYNAGKPPLDIYTGGPYTVSGSRPYKSCIQTFNMGINITVTWVGSIGTMSLPTHYWREVTGPCSLGGVIEDFQVFKGTLTGSNSTMTGSAVTTFLSGGGSFPATAEFTGSVNPSGGITGTLSITSYPITQSVSVTLVAQ
jgi:hypothetical protein